MIGHLLASDAGIGKMFMLIFIRPYFASTLYHVLLIYVPRLFVSLQELIKGESNTEDCLDDQDFDSWEPDPVDANPSKQLLLVRALL